MLVALKTYLNYGHHFCGVEHALKGNQGILYTTVLKKNRNSLDIKNTYSEPSVETLVSKLPKKQHLFLVINNEQVLSKNLESQELDSSKLIYKTFPNISLEDFYFEILVQNNHRFISICRKSYVEDLVKAYLDKGFSIINISLGNTILSSLCGFIKSSRVMTSNGQILFDGRSMVTMEKKAFDGLESYDINGLEIQHTHLLSCAGALQPLLNNYGPSSNLKGLTNTLNQDFKQVRFLGVFLKFGLVFILLTLLVNFFFFNHYFNRVGVLKQTSQLNQTAKERILELNEQVSKSQKMVEDMLKSNSSKSSFYVNAIVQRLPSSIVLSELNYQPVLKRIKEGQPILLEDDILLISGESSDSERFSQWLVDMEKTEWIKNVDILNYEDLGSQSVFNLKLILRNDP